MTSFLVTAGAGIGEVEASSSPLVDVEESAERIVSAMRLIHGGEWRCDIDHEAQFVVIIPSINRPQ